MAPPTLYPDRTYIAVSSRLDPETLSAGLNLPDMQLTYRGPVGELDGEHIFEVERNGPIAPDSPQWLEKRDSVVAGVKRAHGVTGVLPLGMRQREKRVEL